MGVEVRAYDRSKNRLGSAPLTYQTMTRLREWNGQGSLTLNAPLSDASNAVLTAADEPYLVVAVDGVEDPQWYMLDDDGDDLADALRSARPVTVGCRGVRGLLELARVYPRTHSPGQSLVGLTPEHAFAAATPGKIMGDLLAKAWARGAITQLTKTFTDTADSAGRPWPTTYSITYDLGQDYDAVLQGMLDGRWCDATTTQLALNLYVPDGQTADLTQAVIYRGQGVSSGPRKRTRRSIRSVLLGVGDEGAVVEVADSTAQARYGRREGYEGRSGMTDTGTLTAITQASLQRQTVASETFTLEVKEGVTWAPPGVTVRPGDYIRYDQRRLDDVTLEPLRVQSLADDVDADGRVKTSVELIDQWLSRDAILARRIDALAGGSSANERAPQPDPTIKDTVAPSKPASVSITPSVYFPQRYSTLPGRMPQAAATISWPTVTTNEDGTTYDDAGEYLVSFLLPSRSGTDWSAEQSSRSTNLYVSGYLFGETLQARVLTVDSSGNRSPWTYSPARVLNALGGGIPQAPKATVSVRLGQIHVTWNGRALDGQALDPWVVGAEVHVSTDPGFTVADSTRVDLLGQAGTTVIPGIVLGQIQYVRLVLIDYGGNRGQQSDAVSATPQKVVGDDILDGAVGTAKLADLAVVSAKIGDLAVTSAKIASVDVGKITTGSLQADVILSARIRTAESGARLEMSNTGLTAYNASNQTTVRIDAATGNATFAGTITAAQVTGYIRAVGSNGAQIVLRPDAVQTPDAGIAPAMLLASGNSSETSPGGVYAYTEVYSGTRRWLHTMLRSPSFGGAVSYIRLSVVGTPGGTYSSSTYVPAQITFGINDTTSIVAVGNLSSDLSANRAIPGLSFRGTSQIGIRALDNYLDIVNVDGSAWASIRAASFATQSGRDVKTDIAAPDFSALDILRASPAMQWRYRTDVVPDGLLRVGPLADDLPDVVRRVAPDGSQWLDQAAMVGLLYLAAQELADRVCP